MRRLLAAVLVVAAAPAAAAACDPANEDLAGFLAGSYAMIGRLPDHGETYAGAVTIAADGCRLTLLRCQAERRIEVTAEIATATADRIPVLRFRYRDQGREVRGQYLIDGDLDNYAVLTGVWATADSARVPGREYLYVEPRDPVSCR